MKKLNCFSIIFNSWHNLSKNYKLPEEFIEKYQDKFNWLCISKFQELSEEFIDKHQNKVSWYRISKYQKLSEEFIEKYKNKVDWVNISVYQKLSKEFIDKYQNKVDWHCISKYQKLSEEFIEKYQDRVYWDCISVNQQLSEKFIEKYQYKVNWYFISKYQKSSEEFIKNNNLIIFKDNWLYTSAKYKLKYIKNNTNYKIIDGKYIIAYKSIRHDNYSHFNFQYKYEVGKTYYSHCDCNLCNINSFGLSAWTKEEALNYFNKGKILKVKIPIEKIGAIICNNNKIRCFEFQVLEEVD